VLLTYRLEIHGRLPQVVHEELRRRFGEIEVRSQDARTVVAGLTVDQSALRAVLSLLWDVGSEVHLVRAMSQSGEEAEGVEP
jgi:hypothetical protein